MKYIAMFGNDARLLIYKQKKSKKANKTQEYFKKKLCEVKKKRLMRKKKFKGIS
jgi:hypothetical protein